MTLHLDRDLLSAVLAGHVDVSAVVESERVARLLASPPPDVPVRLHRDGAVSRLGLTDTVRRWTEPPAQRVARPA